MNKSRKTDLEVVNKSLKTDLEVVNIIVECLKMFDDRDKARIINTVTILLDLHLGN